MWPFRKVERRSSWSDAVAQLEQLTAEGGLERIIATSAMEIASGMIERAFNSSTVSGANDALQSILRPATMGYIGRQLIVQGESLHLIRINGAIELIPANNWEIYGEDPSVASWQYDVYCSTPSGQYSKRVSSDDVVHVLCGAGRDRPWSGQSGLRNAKDLGTGHARIESSVAKELRGPAGRLLPAPMDPANEDAPAALMAVIKQLVGGPILVESMSSGHGNLLRADARISSDWQQRRIGPDPPAALVQLRNEIQQTAGMVLGLPGELLRSDASSQARREAWRQLYFGTILPLARLTESELRSKLDAPSLRIHFDELGASDLQARARSFQAFAKAGLDHKTALKLCGLET